MININILIITIINWQSILVRSKSHPRNFYCTHCKRTVGICPINENVRYESKFSDIEQYSFDFHCHTFQMPEKLRIGFMDPVKLCKELSREFEFQEGLRTMALRSQVHCLCHKR